MTETPHEAALLSVQTFKPGGLIQRLKGSQDDSGLLIMTNLSLVLVSADGTEQERFSLYDTMEVKHLPKPGIVCMDIAFKGNINRTLHFSKKDKTLVLKEMIPILADICIGRLSVPLPIPNNLADIQAQLQISPSQLQFGADSEAQAGVIPDPPVDPVEEADIPHTTPSPTTDQPSPKQTISSTETPLSSVEETTDLPTREEATADASLPTQALNQEPVHDLRSEGVKNFVPENFDPVTGTWTLTPNPMSNVASNDKKQIEVAEIQTTPTSLPTTVQPTVETQKGHELEWQISLSGEDFNQSGLQAFEEITPPAVKQIRTETTPKEKEVPTEPFDEESSALFPTKKHIQDALNADIDFSFASPDLPKVRTLGGDVGQQLDDFSEKQTNQAILPMELDESGELFSDIKPIDLGEIPDEELFGRKKKVSMEENIADEKVTSDTKKGT